MTTARMYQSVILTFSDGATAIFTGPAVASPGDPRTVERVQFTEPRELPDDCHFGQIEDAAAEATP